MDDIIKLVESLENSGLLVDGANETVKHEKKEKKNEKWDFFFMRGAGIGKEGGFLPLLALTLLIKAMSGKGVARAGKGYNNMDHMEKKLVLLHPLNNIEITKYFNYKPKFNGVFSRDNLPRIKDGTQVLMARRVRNTLGFIIYWQK